MPEVLFSILDFNIATNAWRYFITFEKAKKLAFANLPFNFSFIVLPN
jgi:hypothetical protein